MCGYGGVVGGEAKAREKNVPSEPSNYKARGVSKIKSKVSFLRIEQPKDFAQRVQALELRLGGRGNEDNVHCKV